MNTCFAHVSLPRHVLSAGVLLALTGICCGALSARELDGEDALVVPPDVAEEWVLRNDAKLTVRFGQTRGIVAYDSRVALDNARVSRNGTADFNAIELYGNSTLTALDSRITHGGLLLRDGANVLLRNTSITIGADAPDFARIGAIGIDIRAVDGTARPRVTLNATHIRVADKPQVHNYFAGVGISQGAGDVTVGTGSRIEAGNIGVLMRSLYDRDQMLFLALDDSQVVSERGAAIHIAPGEQTANHYHVQVSNGSQLQGGNGYLLWVGRGDDEGITQRNTVQLTVSNSHLEGNIGFDPATVNGELAVTLFDQAKVTGRFEQVQRAFVASGSTWQMTGDSTVRHLDLGSTGTVALGDGTRLNTLSLDSFAGEGGTLVFNTVLDGDASATDRLLIAGDATGEAAVRVHNAGGQGAQTDRGIALITVGGASSAQFTLLGRAVGGQYEYFLIKAEDGHWYLRSTPGPGLYPDPCKNDPSLCDADNPEGPDGPDGPDGPGGPDEPGKPPTPVLRPETGAYLANLQTAQTLLQHRASDRASSAGAEDGLRTWASSATGESRMDATGQQTLRVNRSRLLLGADVGAFDDGRGRVGAMLSAGQADSVSRSDVTSYRARGTVEGGAAGLYAGWDNSATYLDASVQHGRFSNTVHGDDVAQEHYRMRLSQASLEAGHRVALGKVGPLALNVQPQVQLTYTRMQMDVHVESNGTVVEQAGGDGLTTRIGAALQGEAGTGALQWLPTLAAYWVNEGSSGALSFDGEVIEGGAPERRVEVAAGTQLRLGNGVSAWGGINAARGNDNYREFGAQLGLAYRW